MTLCRLLLAGVVTWGLLLLGGDRVLGADPAGAERYIFGLANEMRYADGQEWEPVVLALDLPPDWEPTWESEGVAVPIFGSAPVRAGATSMEVERTLAAATENRSPRAPFVISRPIQSYEQQSIQRALRRLKGAKLALLLGIRTPGEKSRYIVPISPHDRGMSAPVIPLASGDLTAAVDGSLTYLQVASRERIDVTTWERVRRIEPAELRFLAARDVLAASYGRGLAHAPPEVRLWLIAGVIPATGDQLRDSIFRLRLAVLVGTADRSAESCTAIAGSDQTWLVEAASRGPKEVCAAALSVAGSRPLDKYLAKAGGELALAYLERGDGVTPGELALARNLIAGAPVSKAEVGEHSRALVEGLLKSKDAMLGVDMMELAHLLLDVSRVFPRLGAGLAQLPPDRRDEFESWSSRIKPRTSEDQAVLESLRAEMGWR